MNIGIMMGCVISPPFFVLVMEIILRSDEVNTNEITGLSMMAFMDDVTLIAESRLHMEQLVTCLQELFKWATMKKKPSKCCSFSIIKGSCWGTVLRWWDVCKTIVIVIHNRLKFTGPSWLRGRGLDWRLS